MRSPGVILYLHSQAEGGRLPGKLSKPFLEVNDASKKLQCTPSIISKTKINGNAEDIVFAIERVGPRK